MISTLVIHADPIAWAALAFLALCQWRVWRELRIAEFVPNEKPDVIPFRQYPPECPWVKEDRIS